MGGSRALFASMGTSVVLVAAAAISLLVVSAVVAFGGWQDDIKGSAHPSAIVLAIHFGTFSGVMAATVAGLLMSLATSAAKRLFGYIAGKNYVPGVLNLKV